LRTEQQVTDDERFDLIYSLIIFVLNKDFTQKRDARVPQNIPQTAGWVKGIPDWEYPTSSRQTQD
jgi:hypothetical protein